MKQNPRVQIRGGRFIITHGILLEDIKTFMGSAAPPNSDNYFCDDYEFPEEE